MENTVTDLARNIKEIYVSPAAHAFADKLIEFESFGGVFMQTSDEVYHQWRADLHVLHARMTDTERRGIDGLEDEMDVLW